MTPKRWSKVRGGFSNTGVRRKAHAKRRRGFTLIELLVVVAIISLLVSMLLPSLQRARKQARGAVCMTNLRSLSHGWHMYADDYGDVILPGRFAKEPGGTSNPANWYEVGNGLKYRPRWVAAMGGHVGIYAFNHPRTDDDRQDYDSKVYLCPQVPTWKDERNYAYGYNYQFLGNARKSGGRFINFPVNRSRIKIFAQTVLGADSLGTAAGFAEAERLAYTNDGKVKAALGNHGWSLDPPRLTPMSDKGTGDPGSPRIAVHPRHVGKANAVFCDGHAEAMTPKALGYGREPDGKFLDDGEGIHNRFFSGTGRDDDPPPKK